MVPAAPRRTLAAMGLAGFVACANQGAPPGGPVDVRPPVLIRTEPDTFATVTDLEAPVRFHFDEPFSEVVYGALARDPDVARNEVARTAVVVERAARSIRKGQQRGELPLGVDPRFAGAAMFGAMRLVMVEALGRTPRPAPERVVEVLWRQIAAAVGIEADAARPAPAPRRRSR